MAKADLRFAPGTLLRLVKRRMAHALASGAVHSIETDQRFIEQNGVRFLVRSVSNLERKNEARAVETDRADNDGTRVNPFLPYEPDVFVADISPTHVCLLNKFYVMDHHVLIVTRAFEKQETLLTAEDFEALWACMSEIDGLGFYNSGVAAGASQPHKHIQVVPFPLAGEGPAIPMEPLLEKYENEDLTTTLPGLPFVHAFQRHEVTLAARPTAATMLHRRYLHMLERTALTARGGQEGSAFPKPYNLLLTRGWMLVVPRTREHFNSISINALGFAGSLFVRDRQQVDVIERRGPMNALRAVAVACDD